MRTRVLPVEEWSRLKGTELETMPGLVRPEDVQIVVVEDGQELIATIAVFCVLHLEGMWVRPGRTNGGVIRSLIRKAVELARPRSAGWAMCWSKDDVMRGIVERLGGTKMPLDTYVLSLGGH